jgi:hypothetical protein
MALSKKRGGGASPRKEREKVTLLKMGLLCLITQFIIKHNRGHIV